MKKEICPISSGLSIQSWDEKPAFPKMSTPKKELKITASNEFLPLPTLVTHVLPNISEMVSPESNVNVFRTA